MKLTVYIGYDSSNLGQAMAYSVCRRSIRRYNSTAEIRPIKLDEMRDKGIYYRDNDNKQSTEFTYSRFLAPYLNDFKDYAVFCDSDFLWQTDIEDVLQFIHVIVFLSLGISVFLSNINLIIICLFLIIIIQIVLKQKYLISL